MTNNHHEEELPLSMLISFNKLLGFYEEQVKKGDGLYAQRAKEILKVAEPYPEFREGFSDLSILKERKEEIKTILADTFSPALTKNEIKTVGIPYYNLVFNSSERFQDILKDAGDDFELEIMNMPDDTKYIMMATVVLSFYYGFNLDYKRPLFYDIPDKDGIMRHYRILYNADFMEIIPTEKAKKLKQSDFDELLADSENVELWKEKIPPQSFISKGFVICNIFDVTAEHSISEIKSTLIGKGKREGDASMDDFQETFRSLFNLKDIQVGFSGYDPETNSFLKVYGKGINSFILNGSETQACDLKLCDYTYGKLIKKITALSISDIKKYYKKSKKAEPYKSLYEQGFRSAILAPMSDEGRLLGVLEIVSPRVNELNSINAIKLEDVMPFIVTAVLRSIEEEQNLIDAIIQHECTTVHDSVYWKFQQEAKKFMMDEASGKQAVFNEIVFKDVYPLYGQIDIKDSSKERNIAIQRDLMIHLSEIKEVLVEAFATLKLPIYEELIYRVDNQIDEIKDVLYSNSEQTVFDFVKDEINPVFHHLKLENKTLANLVEVYESHIDSETESYYDHRKNYDESVMEINMQLASLLDRKQEEAQAMFPHYFERYKTDGVEHNLYIGSQIAFDKEFDPLYLNNLRLWQLQTMVEMENKHYALKPHLSVPLDVASLLLVYSTPLAIRFRMDEKKFDVDGTYNARYEIIKKRIDKSYIKGTSERLTQKGKLAIVYSQKKDEREYLRYIKFLKSKGYFTNNIEVVELDGLQGVTGLKAIRAEILYRKDEISEKTYTYEDLMEAIRV